MDPTTWNPRIVLLAAATLVAAAGLTSALGTEAGTDAVGPVRLAETPDGEPELRVPTASEDTPGHPSGPPPGLEGNDPWVDARGDAMTGNLSLGPNALLLNDTGIRSPETGRISLEGILDLGSHAILLDTRRLVATPSGGLSFGGKTVCFATGNCGAAGLDAGTGLQLDDDTFSVTPDIASGSRYDDRFVRETTDSDGYTVSTNLGKAATVDSSWTLVVSGDDEVARVDLPFSFTFFGVTEDHVEVSTNGVLFLGDGDDAYLNQELPTGFFFSDPQALVAAFWDDLIGDVYVKTVGDGDGEVFTVRWDTDILLTGDPMDFSVSLYEDEGSVTVEYHSVGTAPRVQGSSATIGAQGPGEYGASHVLVSLNAPVLEPGDGQFVTFHRP